MRKFRVFRKVSESADTFSELRKFLVIDQSKSTEHSTVKTANYTETIRKYLNLSKVSQYTESFCEHLPMRVKVKNTSRLLILKC